jgi:hypothetical protein
MLIKTFAKCREMESGEEFDFAYEAGRDFRVVLLNSQEQIVLPDDIGEIETVGSAEDAEIILQAKPMGFFDPMVYYRLVVSNVLKVAGYEILKVEGESEELSADEQAERLHSLRKPVMEPRYFQGKRDGQLWSKKHAKIQDLIHLAEMRGGEDWAEYFEADEQCGLSYHPHVEVAMILLGKWETEDDPEAEREAYEFWEERGRDAAYVHGFADGTLAIRDDEGEEQARQWYPDVFPLLATASHKRAMSLTP